MSRTPLWLALLVLPAVACGSGSSGRDSEPSPTAVASPSSSATAGRAAAVPARPDDFARYPEAVAAYLSEAPVAAEGNACLNELFQAWDMAYFSGDRSCRAGSTDADEDDEVAVVLVAPRTGEFEPFDYNIVVFDRGPDGFRVVFEAGVELFGAPEDNEIGNVIVAMEDINGDGQGELVYNRPTCGAHTCFVQIHIVSGSDAGYRELTPSGSPSGPGGGISMSYADYRFEDVDGDGAQELVLHGGSIGSVGAGPNRERTETWGWDGSRYTLRETVLDPPAFLYHAILDANALLADAQFAEAERAFVDAIGDPELDPGWNMAGTTNVGAELQSYAYLRAAVARFLVGGDLSPAVDYLDRAAALDAPLHAPLAAAFRDTYASSGNLAAACDAARAYIADNVDGLTDFWNFGYGNPSFDPEAFCPFRSP